MISRGLRMALLVMFFVSPKNSYSQIKLPAFFTDNMVLQQKTMASIWGTDKPNTHLTVRGSWNETATTVADSKGKWKVKVKTPEAGGPYTLTIEGSTCLFLKM